MELDAIVRWATDICSIATCAALLVKPVREWIMGTKGIRNGQMCLLRSEIIRIYYKHHEDRQLKKYEFENMDQCYKAYKTLGGNSFIDKVHEDMKDWDIV